MIVTVQPLLYGNTEIRVDTYLPPEIFDFAWARYMTWQIWVNSLQGAPTTASLEVEWQMLMVMTSTAWQYATPRWVDLSAARVEELTADNGIPSLLADETTALGANGIGYQGTMFNYGSMIRPVLKPTFSGGTDPHWIVNAVLIAKEGA